VSVPSSAPAGPPSVADLLATGAPALSFDELPPGTSFSGRIIKAPVVRFATSPTGEIKRFPSGQEMPEIVLTIETDAHDHPDDDGIRRLFISGGKMIALRKACADAGVSDLDLGYWVTITYLGQDKPKVVGHNGMKNFEMTVRPS
jgi:hypothetical protein